MLRMLMFNMTLIIRIIVEMFNISVKDILFNFEIEIDLFLTDIFLYSKVLLKLIIIMMCDFVGRF